MSALLLCLLWVLPVRASSLKIGEPPYNGSWHHNTPNFDIQAELLYPSGASNVMLNYFKININGIDYNATIQPITNGFYGHVSIPRTLNPQRFVCYAVASVTWTYYDTRTENLDSRAPASGQDPSGDGKTQEYVLSNIKHKSLTWKDRPNDLPIYEHETSYRAAGTYPNTNQPFHWRQYRDSNGNPTTTEQHGAVYLMGSAPKLEIETEPLDSGVEVRAKIKVEFTSGSGGGALPAGYPFNAIVPLSGNTGSVVCPALKSEVNLYNATVTINFEHKLLSSGWKTIYTRPDDTVGYLRLYTIYSTPGAPMATPWEGVLDYSCKWAAGKSTYNDVARYLTTGLYFSQRFYYPGNGKSSWTDPNDATIFELTNFLNSSGYQPGNCVDVSDFLLICANSQGLGFAVSQYHSDPGYFVYLNEVFDTNPICVIGSNSAQDFGGNPPAEMYQSVTWTMHQVCIAGADNVYDACEAQKYDLSGNLWRNPPFNWPLSGTAGFWQTNTNHPDNPAYTLGLVGKPRPTQPTSTNSYPFTVQ